MGVGKVWGWVLTWGAPVSMRPPVPFGFAGIVQSVFLLFSSVANIRRSSQGFRLGSRFFSVLQAAPLGLPVLLGIRALPSSGPVVFPARLPGVGESSGSLPQLVKANRPLDLLVFPCWSIFSRGPKRLTFYKQVLWASEKPTF